MYVYFSIYCRQESDTKEQTLIASFGNKHFAQNTSRSYTNAMKYSLNFCNEN